jgi:DNA modification methylase
VSFRPFSAGFVRNTRRFRRGLAKDKEGLVAGKKEERIPGQGEQEEMLDTTLTVEWWPTERPLPYAHNPRVVTETAIEKVATSIREYGWRQPLVVDEEGVLLVGHTRLLAAKQLGLPRVPVHVARGLSPEKVKAYRLMDNRSNEETSWNFSLLEAELAQLVGMNLDPLLTGFSPEELTALLNPPAPGLTDPDAVVEPPAVPETKAGDLWICGRHRLLCGDATSDVDVKRLMAGKRATLMATDPPYLVGYDGTNHPGSYPARGAAPAFDWDACPDPEYARGFYERFLSVALQEALKPAAPVYQFFAMMRADAVMGAWRAVGLLPHQVIIWHKTRHVPSRSDFMWNYEPCLYGWKQGRRPVPARRPPAEATALWQIPSVIEDHADGLHPTEKPVELIRRPLEYHTTRGEVIYEPFSGSGTALIAAEISARSCYALELSPAYVDAARLRWENFTGQKAVREAHHA